MYKYDLTVVLPSIRTELLYDFYNSLNEALEKYTFELIIVGPLRSTLPTFNYKNELNIKYVLDYGSPARCLQLGASLAEGEFLTWSSDDALYYPLSLDKCIDLLKTKTKEDVIIVRYSEGVGRTGLEPPTNYWISSTHPDLRFPLVNPEWKTAPVGLYYTETFYKYGGLDCRFEHANMNSHDLVFRMQKTGSIVYESPTLVMGCDQQPGWTGDHGPVEEAYWKNDKDLFVETWSKERETYIPFENWKNAPRFWRRFK